jgi:hypothetical protein
LGSDLVSIRCVRVDGISRAKRSALESKIRWHFHLHGRRKGRGAYEPEGHAVQRPDPRGRPNGPIEEGMPNKTTQNAPDWLMIILGANDAAGPANPSTDRTDRTF